MKTKKLQVIAEPIDIYGDVPEFYIGLKSKGLPMSERPKIDGSRVGYEIAKNAFKSDAINWIETFAIVCLNRANKPIGIYKISQGGVTGTVADPKVIFQCALLCNASGIILSHNHPSGNLTASQADIDLTKKLVASGRLLEIKVLDHIIVTDNGYFSFADEGLI